MGTAIPGRREISISPEANPYCHFNRLYFGPSKRAGHSSAKHHNVVLDDLECVEFGSPGFGFAGKNAFNFG